MIITKILFGFFVFDSSNFGKCSMWDNLPMLPVIFDHFSRMFRSSSHDCDVAFIGDISGLENSLRKKLHGQHLVTEIVTKSLRSNLEYGPKKALTLSFHGSTGVGKSHVSRIIADHLFTDGMRSRFVHLFVSTIHFPHQEKIRSYKDNLISWIKGNVSSCARSLFIFDEMDKMEPGIIDAINPFLDDHSVIDGVSYNKAIFIFHSNTGASELTNLTYNFWKTGRSRTEISFKDVDKLLMDGAFNEQSGLQHSEIVTKYLIDFYVPFLSLLRAHVKLCTKDEIIERNGFVSEELLNAVADKLNYYPPNELLFSTAGCRWFRQKLDLLMEK